MIGVEVALVLCAFCAFIATMVALFVSLVAGAIVYSWWRTLTAEEGRVPERLATAVSDLIAQHVEPLAERLDKRGHPVAAPIREGQDDVILEHEFDRWVDEAR